MNWFSTFLQIYLQEVARATWFILHPWGRMSPLTVLGFLLYVLLLVSAAAPNFQHEVYQYKNSYKPHADAQRLDSALVPPSIGSSRVAAEKSVSSAPLADTSGFQIYTTDTIPASAAASSACTTALTATIACNSTIQLMSYPFDADSLTAMCTSSCSASLLSYRSSVVASCSGIFFTNSANATYTR